MKITIEVPFENCERCSFFELEDQSAEIASIDYGLTIFHKYRCKHREICENAVLIAKMDEEEHDVDDQKCRKAALGKELAPADL